MIAGTFLGVSQFNMTHTENQLVMKKISLHDLENCPVTATMSVIGGKWKILIIHLINNDINRFSKLSLMLRTISRQMLTSQLRELEADGLIRREIFAEIPPHVEYFLTEKGRALMPVLDGMKEFGYAHVLRVEAKVA